MQSDYCIQLAVYLSSRTALRSYITPTFVRCVNRWSDAHALQSTPVDKRVYQSRVILALIQVVHVDDELKSNLITLFTRGVQVHLECVDDERRLIGENNN